jgi:hypothetical protein
MNKRVTTYKDLKDCGNKKNAVQIELSAFYKAVNFTLTEITTERNFT